LQAACPAAGFFNRVVTGLAGRGQLDPENPGGFIFGNLARDSDGFSRQGAVAPGEQFGVSKDLYHRRIFLHVPGSSRQEL